MAAVTGALALSTLAVPAAHADVTATGEPYALNASFSNIKINKGKSIVAGTTGTLTVPITYTLTHGADVDITAEDFFTDVELYYGASQDDSYNDSDYTLYGDNWAHCAATSATVANCTQSIAIHPALDLFNETAGKWKAYAYAVAWNGQDMSSDDFGATKVGYVEKDGIAGPSLLRHSKLSVNATPEPVVKGKTITVTGKLTRANWDGANYTGYASQPVQLQFRKNGTSAYTVVKTIRTTTKGDLKTTVKATADGYFRYVFAGTATTAALGAVPDFVDVK
ncbi:hypothetical protein GCM10023084_17490 [Streptomyces lacrimifluminis]|uniref:Lipoprotein n=1 Tax=Streptomyces lacrimifluminis TaxID=1500077 RepID=A0A917KEI6_9ACTN|nr:hypothetical protein [Streptomyces lacrimifluminis]GGJ08894.1 hypothetical protein GCM10012282_01860 [Streptomyces lacrimifluminis]